MYAGPDNSTCFQHQISLLIQHQQCYSSRNHRDQPSYFPVPVLNPARTAAETLGTQFGCPNSSTHCHRRCPVISKVSWWDYQGWHRIYSRPLPFQNGRLRVPQTTSNGMLTPLSEHAKWFKPCYLLSVYFCFLIPYSFTTETLPVFEMVPLLISISDRFHSWPSGPNDLLPLCNYLGQSLYLELPCSCAVLAWRRGRVNRILKSIHPTLEIGYCF